MLLVFCPEPVPGWPISKPVALEAMLRLVKTGEELKLTPVLDRNETAPEVEIGVAFALKLFTRTSTFADEDAIVTDLPVLSV
jgi:hypothetical protein